MGRKIITEEKLMMPKRVGVAVADALGRPYYQPFMVRTMKLQRTPPKVKHGNP